MSGKKEEKARSLKDDRAWLTNAEAEEAMAAAAAG